MKKLFILSAVSALAAAAASTSAYAQTRTWIGPVNGNWSTATNWNLNDVPDTNLEIAQFANDSGGKTAVNDTAHTVQRLIFVDTGTMTSGFTIAGAANTLTIDGNSTSAFRDGVNNNSGFTQTINTNLLFINSANTSANFVQFNGLASGGNTVVNGSLTSSGTTGINFAGVAGSTTTINGDMTNNTSTGLRFGTFGTVTIAGAGTTSGTGGSVLFLSGTVNLNRTNAVSGANYRLSGSTVNLGADNAFATTNLVRTDTSASSLNTNGFDSAMGILDLDMNLTIDMGVAATSQLSFLTSTSQTWDATSLAFTNFQDVPGSESIRFGFDANGLTPAQLGKISINGVGATIDSQGFLHAVPEPGSVLMLGLGCIALLARRRR